MLVFHENPTFETSENTGTMLPESPPRSDENTGIMFPKSPPRSNQVTDGSNSPPSVIFSWSRMRRAQDGGGGDDEDDDSGPVSPPLWRPGSSTYVPNSSYYHPMSLRAQEIARGRQELMKLYEGMPESAYELSLKDLVDHKAAMEQVNSDAPRARRETDNSLKKKRAPREHMRRKGNDPKSFLLNMFVPSSLTGRSHSPNTSRVVRQNSDQSKKDSPKLVVRKEHPIFRLLSLLRIRPSKKSEVSPSNSFSKVSPRPYFGKDGQTDKPFMDSPNGPKSNSSNICAMCSVYTVYLKIQCEACDKIYCSSCVKSAIANTPEGPRCRATCAFGSNSDSDLEPKLNSCWPILSTKKVKPGRKTKYSFSEE